MSYLLEDPFGLLVSTFVLLALFVPGEKLLGLIAGLLVLWVVVTFTATFLWSHRLLIPVAVLVVCGVYLFCKKPTGR